MLVLIFALFDRGRMSAEDRALHYLIREVPRWSKDNKCFSCHNNGDAARALYTAIRLGRKVPDKALADTTRWLMKPEDWDHNASDQKFSDKQLDRLQFGLTLVDAVDAGLIKDRQPLLKAAELIAAHQNQDGFWPIGGGGPLGCTTTHGETRATVHARRRLDGADPGT